MSDPAIKEAARRALLLCGQWDSYYADEMAQAVLAAVAPLIEAAALEEAAKLADDGNLARRHLAAAIRELKQEAGD